MSNNCINATAQAIIDRLPQTQLLTPLDIAMAFGLKSNHSVYEAAQEGKLAAIRIGNKVLVSRDEVIKWINSLTYQG
jgi:excisionase family DNA binding protein